MAGNIDIFVLLTGADERLLMVNGLNEFILEEVTFPTEKAFVCERNAKIPITVSSAILIPIIVQLLWYCNWSLQNCVADDRRTKILVQLVFL